MIKNHALYRVVGSRPARRGPPARIFTHERVRKQVRGLPILAAWAVVVAGCALASIRSDPVAYADPQEKPPAKASPAPDLEELRDQIVEAHNEIRTAAKLNSLSFSKKLNAAAQRMPWTWPSSTR